MSTTVSRRHFVGGLAAALGYLGTHDDDPRGGADTRGAAASTAPPPLAR